MTRIGALVLAATAATAVGAADCPEVELSGTLRWTGHSLDGVALAFETFQAARVAPGSGAAPARPRRTPATIGPEGRYTVRLPGRGSYLARAVSSRGAAFPPVRVEARRCSPRRQDLLLEGLEVPGRVVDGGDGEPLAGALVRVRWQAADRFEVESGEDGAFALVLPAGPRRVCAIPPPGPALLRTCVDVEVDLSHPPLLLSLPRAARLTGRIVTPPAGPPVTIWARPLAWTRGWGPGLLASPGTRADRDGRFQLDGLRPETHALFASAGTSFGWLPEARPGAEPVALELSPGGEAEIEVSDASGRAEAVTAQVLRVDGQTVEGALDPLPRRPADRRSLFRFAVPAGRVALVLLTASSQGEIELAVEPGQTSRGKAVLDRPRSVPD